MFTWFHKIRKKFSTNSLRIKMIAILLSFILPLVVFLIVYNIYSISLLREETAKSNKNTLRIYSESLDGKLNDVDALLLDIIVSNPNYNKLRRIGSDLDVQMSVFELMKIFESGLNTNKEVEVFFFFNEVNEIQREVYRIRTTNNYSYELKDAIHETLNEKLTNNENHGIKRWFPVYIHDRYFLLRVLGNSGNYVGALIDLSHLPMYLSDVSINDDYLIIYNTSDGQPLLYENEIKENNVLLKETNEIYYHSGSDKKYMIISEEMEAGDLYMTALIPDSSILKGLNTVQISMFILSLMTILIIPLSYIVIRKTIILPIGRLVDTINQIKEGDLDTKMTTFVSDEFSLVSETFNDMIDEIKSLKIIGYEEKIERQKAQLQYLMFQIRPHFFLNSLKNLYGMAEGEQYKSIQEMLLGLSTHFRYIFNDNSKLVTIMEELNYVKNYLNIHNLSVSQMVECNIDEDKELIGEKIPPISIQTFVENSLMHGMRPDIGLKIGIKVSRLRTDEGDYIDIIVSDNGYGYPEDVMNKINFSRDVESFDGHIGIKNVIQRLEIICGHKAQVVASKGFNGGAVTEMIIPIENNHEQREDD